jgi:hypothetical protein
MEIIDERLKAFYQGDHLLEVWTKQGERIFQRVMVGEITHWRVHDGVLIFRASAGSRLIYVLFLRERKMAAVQHPFDNFQSKTLTSISPSL